MRIDFLAIKSLEYHILMKPKPELIVIKCPKKALLVYFSSKQFVMLLKKQPTANFNIYNTDQTSVPSDETFQIVYIFKS